MPSRPLVNYSVSSMCGFVFGFIFLEDEGGVTANKVLS